MKKTQVYRSMTEFQKRFLPAIRKGKIIETPEEASVLGVNMARESIKKIKVRFT